MGALFSGLPKRSLQPGSTELIPREMRSSQAGGSALLAEGMAITKVQRRQKRTWHVAGTDRKRVWPGVQNRKEGCEMKGGRHKKVFKVLIRKRVILCHGKPLNVFE